MANHLPPNLDQRLARELIPERLEPPPPPTARRAPAPPPITPEEAARNWTALAEALAAPPDAVLTS